VDFTLGETQQAVAQAAAHALDRNPPLPDGHALWKELGQAGLLGLALPAWLGGDGLGVLDTAVLLTEVGRRAAPGPALATLAMGVLPVTRWGSRELQQALLDGVAAGDTILTAAVREPSDPMPPAPATTVRNGAVSGVKTGVPYGAAARWILVPASLASGGTAVAVVDPSAGGVRLRSAPSSAGGPEYTLHLDDAPVAHLLGDDHAVTGLHQLALAGAACLADGALAGCWRLETGREAGGDLDVATYWLADQAPGALRTCHHLHGGTGMDVTYPLHRYSALVKDLVRLVGGADYRLDRLGARAGAGAVG
jgi:alkylation response protein AidB-like acyl-CoA dehydrogenase